MKGRSLRQAKPAPQEPSPPPHPHSPLFLPCPNLNQAHRRNETLSLYIILRYTFFSIFTKEHFCLKR